MKVFKKVIKSKWGHILTEDVLKTKYITENKSAFVIAKEFGCLPMQIYYRLHKFGIRVRTISESKEGKCFGKNNSNFGNHKLAGKNNPMYGKSGKQAPSYIDGRHSTKYYCKCCNKQITRTGGKYKSGFCSSCSHRKQMERQLKTRKVGSLLSGYYKDVWMRSGWEIKFAQFLDCSGIQWEYEPEAFKLVLDNKITNYTPDFYLPEFDYYIEIKGWWRHNSKEKFAKFNRKYKHINIILLQMKELTEMGILCKK